MTANAVEEKCPSDGGRRNIQHIMGYFKEHLSKDEKQNMPEVIEDHLRGYAPLIAPVLIGDLIWRVLA